jgi:hypothetical protein
MLINILPHLYFVQNPDQVRTIGDRIRMLRSKYFFTNVNYPLTKRLCLCMTPLSSVKFDQVIESFRWRDASAFSLTHCSDGQVSNPTLSPFSLPDVFEAPRAACLRFAGQVSAGAR